MSELTTTYKWKDTPWRKLERKVFKLQKRIYRAKARGDVKKVRKLQKLLMKSWSAKCLAVRRVTQDNQGKKTAGVDGQKCLSPEARLLLVKSLKLETKAAPTRRVWLPKPGTDEKRPLGIPTIQDRALQALVKLALEPEWEARFEPNSYGFRPGRSCLDAIEALFDAIKYKPKYVLDADIAQCFDRINHKALLDKLQTFPTLRRQVRAWLKAGVMDGKQLFPTSEGTPQGGVLSPLLANIVLHGMEERIKQAFPRMTEGARKTWFHPKGIRFYSPKLIRYADDFVILHEDINVVAQCRETISDWLKDIGLELKPSKTRITHTLNEYQQQKPGLNFLGFTIRQFPVGKCHSGKNPYGVPLGYKTIITPSQEKLKLHTQRLGAVVQNHKALSQSALIAHINPIIRGWSNYYSRACSTETFRQADTNLFSQLKAWARHRHPNKSLSWVYRKYWHAEGNQNWVFKHHDGLRLVKHTDIKIERHIKVKGDRSPYDGDWVYWSKRMGKHPEVPTTVATLLKRQKGQCAQCGLFFKDGDLMEIDHILPRSKGGKNNYKNLQLLHRHCHDEKTAQDLQNWKQNEDLLFDGAYDKSQVIEEPDEGKLSRPVLKTSRRGDSPA
ncbi:MAG: group II intron reverse transcriptase/maturase [Cyanobacteriota bacterium]|nr:group II intron reverse transcriptase/maturase [Cyanobacteriota bacterium]